MKSSVSGETESPIEFELTGDELLESSQTSVPPLDSDWRRYAAQTLRMRGRGIVPAVSIALAVVLFGISMHVPRPVAQPQSRTAALARDTLETPATPETLSTSSSKAVAVRVANPFDATEVFEFPPGTSRQYAREKVAELLLDRARGRHVRHGRRSRNRRELRNS